MKLIKQLFILMILLVVFIPAVNSKCSDLNWEGGNGTLSNPYGIGNCSQLQQINNDYDCLDKSFKLVTDIDCNVSPYNTGSGFTPIGNGTGNGTVSYIFKGTFDGQGHTISGLFINNALDLPSGLFGRVGEAAIFNLTLSHVDITTQNDFAGGLIGRAANVDISDVKVIGSVYNSADCAGSCGVGGIVGYATGKIIRCNVTGTLQSKRKLGGIVGEFSGVIRNCYFNGTIKTLPASAYASWWFGGLVGDINYGSNITQSSSKGTIQCATSGYYLARIGGIAGELMKSYGSVQVTESFSTMNISCSYASYGVGGIVGYVGPSASHLALINNTYFTGSVIGGGSTGGICGTLGDGGLIENSYSNGTVNTGGSYKGGLVGKLDGGSCKNSFWDVNTSGISSSACGIAKPTAEMKNKTTFTNAGWDFVRIWKLDPQKNGGYPFLRWLPPQLPVYSNFISFPHTTNLSAVPDLTNVTNLTLETLYGMLQFPHNHSVNVSGQNLDDSIIFGDCYVSVNLSGLDYTFNATAYLLMNNSDNHCGNDRIYYAPGVYTNADAIRQHDTVCTDCIKLIADNHKVKFRVFHFSSYAIGSNANLTIYDNYEGSSAQPNANIIFYANYTNKSGSHISGGTCTIYFDGNSSERHNMTDNGNNYNYTSSFSSTGTHNYNITCSATGYNTLSAVDDVEVSSVVPEFSLSLLLIVGAGALILFIVVRTRL